MILLLGCDLVGKGSATDTSVATDPDTDTDTDTDADTDADTDTDTDTDADTDTDVTDTDTDTGTPPPPWNLPACPPNAPTDPVSIFTPAVDVRVVGTDLVVDLGYSGCSPGHPLNMCFDTAFVAGAPPTLGVNVTHDGLNEYCMAFFYDTVIVDLVQVEAQYLATYGVANGAVDLEVTWPAAAGAQMHTVNYAF